MRRKKCKHFSSQVNLVQPNAIRVTSPPPLLLVPFHQPETSLECVQHNAGEERGGSCMSPEVGQSPSNPNVPSSATTTGAKRREILPFSGKNLISCTDAPIPVVAPLASARTNPRPPFVAAVVVLVTADGNRKNDCHTVSAVAAALLFSVDYPTDVAANLHHKLACCRTVRGWIDNS